MVLKASFNIIESEAVIQKKILEALKPQVDKFFKKSFDKIKNKLSDIVIGSIISSPEYNELINGQLKAEFGLPDSSARLRNILDIWKNINFEYTGVKNNSKELIGSFSLNMIKNDYSDVLSTQDAVLVTEKGTELNWLEWLLLFGDKTIVKDYSVILGSNRNSRTGMAVMAGVVSGKWGVPSQFSGTQNNNWITRSIDSVDNEINNLLINSFKV